MTVRAASVIDCDKPFVILNRMAKVKPEPRFARRKVRLTAEEFASLKEVGNRPMQRTIPDEHRDRLVAAGYVRKVVPRSAGASALALTGAGRKRLDAGK
jgi:hypothetical protein